MRLTRPRRQARSQQAQPAAVATQPNPNPKEQQNPKPSLFFRSPVEQACDSSTQLPQAAVAAAPTARAAAGGGEGGGERHRGTIKAYDAVKGFGFIVPDGADGDLLDGDLKWRPEKILGCPEVSNPSAA